MSILSFLGFGSDGLAAALRKGSPVIDVRSAAEFDRAKIPGTINIPIDRIDINAQRIKGMRQPVIFCCNSGDRSRRALAMMRQKGLKGGYATGNMDRLHKLMGKYR